jgi:hypothetical protein
MEKMYVRGTERQREEVIESITQPLVDLNPEDCGEGRLIQPTQLFLMMKDQFANYVVQKMVDISSERHREILMENTQPFVLALKRFTFGKHMVARLERMKLLSVVLEGH